MNAVPTLPDREEGKEADRPTTSTWSRRDHAARPALTLGPKAALLQLRRQRQFDTRLPGNITKTREASEFSTRDAALSYLLRPAGSALYVERTQRRPLGSHVVHSMVFSSCEDFIRWCDADPLRFDDPCLHRLLCRRGKEYFGEGA